MKVFEVGVTGTPDCIWLAVGDGIELVLVPDSDFGNAEYVKDISEDVSEDEPGIDLKVTIKKSEKELRKWIVEQLGPWQNADWASSDEDGCDLQATICEVVAKCEKED